MSADGKVIIPEWLIVEMRNILEQANAPQSERKFQFKRATFTVSDGIVDLVTDVTRDGVTMKRYDSPL